MPWLKHNQTAYSYEGDKTYTLYHTPEGLKARCAFYSKWHIVFWPEKGIGKPTVIGFLNEDWSEQKAMDWANIIITNHAGA